MSTSSYVYSTLLSLALVAREGTSIEKKKDHYLVLWTLSSLLYSTLSSSSSERGNVDWKEKGSDVSCRSGWKSTCARPSSSQHDVQQTDRTTKKDPTDNDKSRNKILSTLLYYSSRSRKRVRVTSLDRLDLHPSMEIGSWEVSPSSNVLERACIDAITSAEYLVFSLVNVSN